MISGISVCGTAMKEISCSSKKSRTTAHFGSLREELQHRTSGTTYVSSEIQRNIQSDDLEEEIQQCKISLDSIIQKGPIDTVIRSIVNFYAEKLRNNKVTYNIVEKCLTEYRKNANTYKPKEPELFIEISKSIGHKKYCKTYYKNNDDGKKCDWDKKANDNFKLIIGKYESYTNKLKSNRGNIKTGFWEYVCFILSKHGHNNYTPTQCAVKYKNCKAKKK
ncbi:14173_t:CDS:2 [Rhizophagus irregularis]|nr:14173_t:CDS:2 [Rhizophagus irregularis]